MPRQTTLDIRLNDVISSLIPAITALKDFHGVFQTPFIQVIAETSLSLINTVTNVKRNKSESVELLGSIHEVIYCIISILMQSETAGSLPPVMLEHLGKFLQTVNQIHTFVEAQQDGNTIKNFLRRSELNTLLKYCRSGLQQALELFKASIEAGATALGNIDMMKRRAEDMHRELLELISTSSDYASDNSSLVQYYLGYHGSCVDRGFKLWLVFPPTIKAQDIPRNQLELQFWVQVEWAKTTLARAVLHHPSIAAKYELRCFVAVDSATNHIELVALVASHLGLKPEKDSTKAVIRHLSKHSSGLLILDNLETTWEQLESRGGVEEFLSLLTEVPTLALIITMRGAERPAKVSWTRPFLLPLTPLSDDAAWQTFIDITDDSHDKKDVIQLLRLTDNMPLAIDLIAQLVDYEGSSNVLTRWETERTSILSNGWNKRSSLDASIAVSLSVLDCRLCQAAAKALVPIREYMLKIYPPSLQLVHPLFKHFWALLELFRQRTLSYGWTPLMDYIPALFPQPRDPRLEASFSIELLCSAEYHSITNPELLSGSIIDDFHVFSDSLLESRFYNALGTYHHRFANDTFQALQYLEKAVILAESCGSARAQYDQDYASSILSLAELDLEIGEAETAVQWNLDQAEKTFKSMRYNIGNN
ncbi:hypothetical protein B0H14DRAFT_3548064 [Mycena olivaceomarginata]|nr:hypothetical protein B0H14DRAFT_3548064 [Mycena olivaceomarginata]